MNRTTIDERALAVIQKQDGWRRSVALGAAVDVRDVERLISERDERVMDMVRLMAGLGGRVRAVDTQVKKFLEKVLRAAAWDRRLYAVFGPTGCGKTFAINAVLPDLPIPAAFIRVNEVIRHSRLHLIVRISSALGEAVKRHTPARAARGLGMVYYQVKEHLSQQRVVVIIDEAQRMNDATFELLRDLYDETEASLVLIGSNAFKDRLAKKKITDEIFGQFLRRLDDRYELPPTSMKDVKMFLAAYGIDVEQREARIIATKINKFGSIDTLSKSMRLIAGSVNEGELTWKNVGGGNVVDALDRIISTVQVTGEEE